MSDDDLKNKAGTSAAATWFILSIILTIVIYDWHHIFTFKFMSLIVIGVFFSALTIGVAKYFLARVITKMMYQKQSALYFLPFFTLLLTTFEWGIIYIVIDKLLHWLFG